jgi:16S rRNA G966 N2-methylase RsmD
MHAYENPVDGARVLDLFAGTGALGIEAVSRGAAFTLFVDSGAEARALLRNNVEALGLGGVTKVYRRDATNLGPAYPVEPFSLVFLDPPYGRGLPKKQSYRCGMATGSRRERLWWWRNRRRQDLLRRKGLKNSSAALTMRRSLYFCGPIEIVCKPSQYCAVALEQDV